MEVGAWFRPRSVPLLAIGGVVDSALPHYCGRSHCDQFRVGLVSTSLLRRSQEVVIGSPVYRSRNSSRKAKSVQPNERWPVLLPAQHLGGTERIAPLDNQKACRTPDWRILKSFDTLHYLFQFDLVSRRSWA